MIATAVVGAAGVALGGAKFLEGRKLQRDAQSKIDSFEWEDLKNAYEGQRVSTLGSDLRSEEAARMSSTAIDTLRAGGTRAIVGGLGRVVGYNNNINRENAIALDEQQQRINAAISNDNARIRDMDEIRQTGELGGYGQMLNVGMNTKYGGLNDAINGAGMIGNSLYNINQSGATNNTNDQSGVAYKDTLITNVLQPEVSRIPINSNQPQQNFSAPAYSAGAGDYGMGYGAGNFVNNFYDNLQKFKNRPY